MGQGIGPGAVAAARFRPGARLTTPGRRRPGEAPATPARPLASGNLGQQEQRGPDFHALL